MNHRDRKMVITEANKRIKENLLHFNGLESGIKEKVQDDYIAEVCKENGFLIEELYADNGKRLNHLLNK